MEYAWRRSADGNGRTLRPAWHRLVDAKHTMDLGVRADIVGRVGRRSLLL